MLASIPEKDGMAAWQWHPLVSEVIWSSLQVFIWPSVLRIKDNEGFPVISTAMRRARRLHGVAMMTK
jgi:hypothetical protein